MATDFLAIADALATKFAAISGIRGATAEVPDAIAMTPYVVVFPPNGLLTRPLSQDVVETDFPSHLYLARPADTGRTLKLVYPYLESVLTAFRTGITLGGLATETFVESWEIDDMPDYEGRFMGIRFKVKVRSRENISRTS
jgi:hypothetical protein